MRTVFSPIFPGEIKMPEPNIRLLLDSYRVRQRTGVVRLGYTEGKQLCFLFKRGEILNVFLLTPEKWQSLKSDEGLEAMSSAGNAYTKSVSLSNFGLLMTKLVIQSHDGNTEMLVKQDHLAEYLDRTLGQTDVALVHLSWENAMGTVFIERDAKPHLHFASKDIFLDEVGSYKIFCEWNEPQCGVTLLSPDLEMDAWREYYLRRAFAKICEDQISRFEILTGRTLVDSLVRFVAVFAARQNLNISITSRNLEDHEVFSSPRDAANHYGLLLSEMFKNFSAVVGPRLHISTMREIVKGLPALEHRVVREFELLPQGYFYE